MRHSRIENIFIGGIDMVRYTVEIVKMIKTQFCMIRSHYGVLRASLIFFFGILLLSIPILAEETPDVKAKSGFGIAPFPVIASSPDTSLMLGAGSVLYYTPEAGKVDSMNILGFYTLKKQYRINMSSDAYFLDDRILFKSKASLAEFPSEYFGIGPNTPENGGEKYTPDFYQYSGSFLYRLANLLYIGPSYDIRYEKMRRVENDGILDKGEIPGSEKTLSSGLGVHVVLDSRNSSFNPESGFYAEIKGIRYSKRIESDHVFSSGDIDLRGYMPSGWGTLCAQMYGAAAQGDIPFYYYPSLGGDNETLRGYLKGRYIDKRLLFSQIEYRMPIYWRIGAAGFFGAGEVAPEMSSFGSHVRYVGGVGLRLMIDNEKKVNVRFDYTYNGKNSYVYANILEAF